MKILSIDATSKILSVALLENDTVIDEIIIDNERTHSENLLPVIAEILEKNKMDLSDISLISCCVGPGSFTGIRIGIATIKAISEVKSIPIVSVTSLETLARIDISEKTKVTLIDARNSLVYCGIFDESYQLKEGLISDGIENVIPILRKYDDVICIGDGAILHSNLIKSNLKNVEISNEFEQRASLSGKIAYQKYLKNELQNADTLNPIYLKKSQAERLKKN